MDQARQSALVDGTRAVQPAVPVADVWEDLVQECERWLAPVLNYDALAIAREAAE